MQMYMVAIALIVNLISQNAVQLALCKAFGKNAHSSCPL